MPLYSKFPPAKAPIMPPKKFVESKYSVWGSVLDIIDKYNPCFNVSGGACAPT